MSLKNLKMSSLTVHAGRPERVPGGPLNPDVRLSSTYHQGGVYSYGRETNPTWESLETAVGELEGGQGVEFASGTAAISAVVECLAPGTPLVSPTDAYRGTRGLFSEFAEAGTIRLSQVDVSDLDATIEACRGAARSDATPRRWGSRGLLWLESPTNPLLDIADIAALSEAAHELGMVVVVDNTFATPILQRPLTLGADVVVHSATKFLGGHSDVIGGVAVAGEADTAGLLRDRRSMRGSVPGAWDAWLVLRGLRTLSLRVERAQQSAAALADRLESHGQVSSVRYPGLGSHKGHDVAKAQMAGFGCLLAFEVAGGAESADRVVERLELVTAATSLGGVESLIERRARYRGEEHVPPSLLRLSVGIEDVEDLWSDLDQALNAET